MENKRTFQDKPATLEKVPLLCGLVGPSGSGKTYSALRVATGIQRVSGGDIGFIDTEARRALHYSKKFKFRHVAFGAPFGPLDYLAAIEHFVSRGVKTIVVDSMSHEHEGPGGVLEMHEQETDRLANLWHTSRDKAQMSAWAVPKAQRRRLINSILQMDINAVFCFRAKEKIKIVAGKNPIPLGWMPIAGEEFVYEMTVNCLLYPACGGVPVWNPGEQGERTMIKLPEMFRELFAKQQPLSEEIGETMARWAAGETAPGATPAPTTTAPKKRDPAAGMVQLMALGDWPNAEARILTSLGRLHRSELTEEDGQVLAQYWKQLKQTPSLFDSLFPEVETSQPEAGIDA